MENLEKALDRLDELCAVRHEMRSCEKAYILEFLLGPATVTVRILLKNHSGAQLVITNMTTLPEEKMHRGFGTHALQILLHWAIDHGMRDIHAVQVTPGNEEFWKRNGFVPLNNVTNDFAYEYHARRG